MPMKPEREYRAMVTPLTIATTEKRFNTDFYAEGYATTFDKPYLLFEDSDGIKYYEVIERHALDSADMSDLIFQYEHRGRVYARTSNNTLGYEINNHGLFIFADLSKSAAAKDMHEEIHNQLVTKMSWGFRSVIENDRYERGLMSRTRIITKMHKVYDVSAVARPANGDTEISVRSCFSGVIEAEKREALARRTQTLLLQLNLEV